MRLIVTELKDDMLLNSYQTYANSCSEDEDDTDKRKSLYFFNYLGHGEMRRRSDELRMGLV